jgi:hypothetical protein
VAWEDTAARRCIARLALELRADGTFLAGFEGRIRRSTHGTRIRDKTEGFGLGITRVEQRQLGGFGQIDGKPEEGHQNATAEAQLHYSATRDYVLHGSTPDD